MLGEKEVAFPLPHRHSWECLAPFFQTSRSLHGPSDGSFQPRRSGAAYSLTPAAFSWEETGGGEKKKEKMKKEGKERKKKKKAWCVWVCVCGWRSNAFICIFPYVFGRQGMCFFLGRLIKAFGMSITPEFLSPSIFPLGPCRPRLVAHS